MGFRGWANLEDRSASPGACSNSDGEHACVFKENGQPATPKEYRPRHFSLSVYLALFCNSIQRGFDLGDKTNAPIKVEARSCSMRMLSILLSLGRPSATSTTPGRGASFNANPPTRNEALERRLQSSSFFFSSGSYIRTKTPCEAA